MSKPSTEDYREKWDQIFNKKDPPDILYEQQSVKDKNLFPINQDDL